MWRYVLALVALLAGCTAAPSRPEASLVGQYQLPPGMVFADTVVGGLSGVSYNAADQRYYVISDDKGEHGPIRFYTVDLSVDSGISAVRFEDVRPLEGSTDGVDAEGIAVDPQRQRVYWSTEGGRPNGDDEQVDPQPWIRIAGLDGSNLGEFLLPTNFVVAAQPGFGMRPNNGLEGLTLEPGGRFLFAGLEDPLYGDPDDLVRITQFDIDTAKPLAQYGYRLDPAPEGRANGLADMAALSDTEFLVLERAGGPGPVIRLYRAEIGSAVNTLDLSVLPGDLVPMSKTLVADLSAPGGPVPLDNLEGITLGPTLPDGRQTVVMVSDDNFNPAQLTQFVAYALAAGAES